MSPNGPATENVTSQEDAAGKKTEAMSNVKTREPKLLFAVAKNVKNATTATGSKKQPAGAVVNPEDKAGESSGSRRTIFGIVKRAQVSKADLLSPEQQQSQPSEENHTVKQQPATTQDTKEVLSPPQCSTVSIETEDPAELLDIGAKAARTLVVDVRDTLENILEQLDSLDPRKLLAIRLGGELRGLLGKAQDEFAAYEAEFIEHASSDGVSVALQNFSASLEQVSTIAERLRTTKFFLNRTFKGEQAAGLGCPVAMTCLGQMYFAGNGAEKDLLVAGKWFELGVSTGDIEACYQLGLLMCEKAAHLKDTLQSEEFLAIARVRFTQAANQGHRDAQYELGVFHEFGRGGCGLSDMEAATWYAKAAEQDHTKAEASLGRIFLVGSQVQQDVAKAVHFLQRAAAKAADAGSSVAMTRLANLLFHPTPQVNDGLGASSASPSSAQFGDREESHDEALRLLLNAGNGGHTDAYYALGKLLETSTLLRDQSAALRFYSKAAMVATPHRDAAKRVATMYYSAIGCKTDKPKSHRLYTIAAMAGDAEALNALGLMYEEGDGCDLNFQKAAECYRTAADLNNPHAHFNLGCLLSRGKGVPRNPDAAQAHYRKAMELGYSLAQQFVVDDARETGLNHRWS
ncbi:hypothetical protein PHMEG_0003171 [Phytophthora megakarya]|uniref:Uncharacterized protein n=1 Tax=Phytophthora megakarya TaxID=4795 RepID=A0A225WWQ1_9STRA|nr:hypothetical protein PHMEG_0003171 [Phytophthora megakarya]